jgi:hypothetical protein
MSRLLMLIQHQQRTEQVQFSIQITELQRCVFRPLGQCVRVWAGGHVRVAHEGSATYVRDTDQIGNV